jgi:hypothetical protein
MYNKANLLTTLVDEDAEGVEFDFAGEFMPEFEGEGKADPEYYQLWRNGEVFEHSGIMDLFSTTTFEHQKLKVGQAADKPVSYVAASIVIVIWSVVLWVLMRWLFDFYNT